MSTHPGDHGVAGLAREESGHIDVLERLKQKQLLPNNGAYCTGTGMISVWYVLLDRI